MTINELSRVSQLDANRHTVLAKHLADKGIDIAHVAGDIRIVIGSMDAVSAAKAAGWYFEAHNYAVQLADMYNVSVEIAAGVLSAVSPRMPWLRNKKVAAAILARFRDYSSLSAIDAAKEMNLGLGNNVAMAIRIARGETISNALTGIKRQSFYNNIVSPHNGDSVTVDTWMINSLVRVYGMAKSDAEKLIRASQIAMGGTGVGYFVVAEAVRMVAAEMDMHAHQIQAMYWVGVSGDFNGGRTDIQ